jgi:hypothetical protein
MDSPAPQEHGELGLSSANLDACAVTKTCASFCAWFVTLSGDNSYCPVRFRWTGLWEATSTSGRLLARHADSNSFAQVENSDAETSRLHFPSPSFTYQYRFHFTIPQAVIRLGLSNVYTRQEKVGLALYHFQRAASLHPTSSVLLCHVGVVCNGLIGRFSASFRGAQDNACPVSFCQALQSLGRSDEALLAYFPCVIIAAEQYSSIVPPFCGVPVPRHAPGSPTVYLFS